MEKKKTHKTRQEKPAAMDFEKALQELESIAQELEQGELGLEESISRYERGMKLAGFCHARLEEAEKKIELLQKRAGETGSREVGIDAETGEIEDDDDMQGSLL